MVTGSTPISQLPTGTIDALSAVFPISIGMPSSPVSIRSQMQAVSEFMNMGYSISPTISGQSLLVAIKGEDGNDPSASNPVRFQLGTTFYYLTSATSYSAPSGTNWHNAGNPTGTAANDIDYFEYAIEETGASAGLKFGHSRIPFALTMGDFVNTSTNEKYIKGNWTNFNSTDKVRVIGRFRAQLSASPFVWSIPSAKVINYPIWQTDILTWTPIPSASSSTWPATITTAEYTIRWNELKYDVYANGTTGGTPAELRLTLPFDARHAAINIPAGVTWVTNGGAALSAVSYPTSSGPSILASTKYDASNFSAGANRIVASAGSYYI